MDISRLQHILSEFSKEREWEQYHTPKNIVMALTAELGELNEVLQWLTNEEILETTQEVKVSIEDEVADIFIYLLIFCMKMEIDLEEVVLSKIVKNRKKYPLIDSEISAEKETKQ